ncbi:MAG TPA: hypothetical protein VE591_08840, partial [Candidatus Acidoferrum sp.]|nr:hypothetical protein [Candidatus Acidoferrum sp.]
SRMRKEQLIETIQGESGGESRSEKRGSQRRGEAEEGPGPEFADDKHLKYAKWITSPDDGEDRPGQTLATRSHDVIRAWAEERDAKPATIEGTEHDDHLGVLRFNFPGYAEDGKLQEVSWDEWFRTFDERNLVFIYQEHRSDGKLSNFFRLESPDREDA